jgi:hypothetical protein
MLYTRRQYLGYAYVAVPLLYLQAICKARRHYLGYTIYLVPNEALKKLGLKMRLR